MQIICKYILREKVNKLQLPKNAKILTVQEQDKRLAMWVQLNPETVTETREILVFFTNENFEIPLHKIYTHIGTILHSNNTVYHIFDTSIVESVDAITSFTGQYKWLSNEALCDIDYKGKTTNSVKEAYTAAKNQYDKNPYTYNMSRNTYKLTAMKIFLSHKFKQEPFRTQLIATQTLPLVAGNTWGDTFWGVCKGEGENHLGKLIMEIRESLVS